MSIDIYEAFRSITKCRRCECLSCNDGYENHEHYCTNGPNCVESKDNLLKWQRQVQFTIGQIYSQMRSIETSLKN